MRNKKFFKLGLYIAVAVLTAGGVGTWIVLADTTAVDINDPINGDPIYVQPGAQFVADFDLTADAVGTGAVEIRVYDGANAVAYDYFVYDAFENGTVDNVTSNVLIDESAADGIYDLKVAAKQAPPENNTWVWDIETDAVVVDGTPPTIDSVEVSDNLINESDNLGTLDVIVTFDETMDTGFDPTISFDADIEDDGTLTFAGPGVWSDEDTVYTATYDIADTNQTNFDVDVIVEDAQDLAGNVQDPNPDILSGADLIDVDTVAPAVSGGFIIVTGNNGTGGEFISGDTITASWDNSVATGDGNLDIDSVTVDFSEFGGDAAVVAVNTDDIWTATYELPDDVTLLAKEVSVTATDVGENETTNADNDTYDVDTEAPTVVIASVTPDPTNIVIAVTAEFSEDVVNFVDTDVDVENGAVENFVPVDGNSYTFDVNPTDGQDVAVTISIPDGVAEDAAGNGNIASNELEYNSDTVAPELDSALINSDTQISVALTELANPATIDLDNDGGFTVTETGGILTYVVSAINPGATDAEILLTVADMGVSAAEGVTVTYTQGGNGVVADLAGNLMDTDLVGVVVAAWDQDPPILSDPVIDALTNDPNPEFTFNSTEGGDIAYDGGCLSADDIAVAGPNSVTLDSDGGGTPLGEATYSSCTLTVEDEAGNVSDVLAIPEFTIDLTPPELNTVSWADEEDENTSISGGDNIVLTFSEEIDQTTLTDPDNDLQLSGGHTFGTTPGLDWNVDGDVLTITLDDDTDVADGDTVDPADTVLDIAGNADDTAAPLEIQDNVAPELTDITIDSPTNDPTPDLTFNSTEDGDLTYGGSCSSADDEASVGENTITLEAALGGDLEDNAYDDCTLTIEDAAGNASIWDIQEFTVDTEPPTILSVTSDTADGYYTDPDVINVTVTFSEDVTTDGEVNITLETGDEDEVCTIDEITDSNTGTCDYTVQDDDASEDLDVIEIADGPISDQAGNELVDYSIPADENLADHENIIIDTVHPIVDIGTDPDNKNEEWLQEGTVDEDHMGTYAWTQEDGEGTMTFTPDDEVDSLISVDTSGRHTFTFRLTATDLAGNIGFDETDVTYGHTSGGGGGGGTSALKYTTATTTGTQTLEQLQTEVARLIALLAQMQGAAVGETTAPASVCPYTWARSLDIGSSGADVLKLQQFLNSDPATILTTIPGAVGSAGHETSYYGALTGVGVSKFQTKYASEILTPIGLTTATTKFGEMSRAKANALCTMAPVSQ
jgi:hypothetical protein